MRRRKGVPPHLRRSFYGRETPGSEYHASAHPLTPALSPASAGEREICNSAPRNDEAAALARHLEHQLVHAAHEPGRILELPALGEERLVEEQISPVGEARLLLVQALHHRMRRIDLEDRLRLRSFLSDRLENPREIASHVVLVGDQARGRSGEARGDANVLHPVAERVLQFREERPVPARLLRLLFLLLVGLELGEIELALRDRGERLALVLGEIRDQPLVDALRQEQHLDPALAEDFQVGAVFRRGVSLRGHVVDLVLSRLHARDVIGERYALLLGVGMGGGETQELRDPLAVRKILAHAFLQDAAEFLPEARVFVLLALGEVLEQAEDALGAAGADRLDVAALLQDLARAHKALAWLTVSSSSVAFSCDFSLSHFSFFITIGIAM